jgi:hypothetical protein
MRNAPRIYKVGRWVILGMLVLAPAILAQTTEDVTYTWTPPTSGAPVDHYVVEHSVDEGPWVQVATVVGNTFTLAATLDGSHQIRVAGVDELGRQGPFSEPSDPYTPGEGPPSEPGKPIPVF